MNVFVKSRPLILGAKWDILIDNLFAGVKIKNNGHFEKYLTNVSIEIESV